MLEVGVRSIARSVARRGRRTGVRDWGAGCAPIAVISGSRALVMYGGDAAAAGLWALERKNSRALAFVLDKISLPVSLCFASHGRSRLMRGLCA